MIMDVSRRAVMAGAASLLAFGTSRAGAQTKPKVRFSCAFPETDMRGEAFKTFANTLKDDFDFEPYWLNALFKQGTELVAMQRGNLEMCNLAPADVAKQVPAWSLMTSAYLFRDYDHLNKTFKSDVGQEMIKAARDQLGIEIIRPVYFGARNVSLRTTKKISTPADLSGVKLRMPPGEYWQFLGEAIGVNPTPIAVAELYTALQAGAVDGQDNPSGLTRNQKFYEVLKQYILTGHVIGYDVLAFSKKTWEAFTPEQQTRIRAAADKAFDDNAARHIAADKDNLEFFKKEGLQVYQPDQDAFRTFAQKKYVEKYGRDWPKGAIEKINAVK